MLTAIQIACQTQYTRTGERNMKNRKPYRSKALKEQAKKSATKTKGGFYTSPTKVLYH